MRRDLVAVVPDTSTGTDDAIASEWETRVVDGCAKLDDECVVAVVDEELDRSTFCNRISW